MRGISAALAASLVFGSAGSAAAQDMSGAIGAAVGNAVMQAQYAQCMGGTTRLSAEEAREADAPAGAAMSAYWNLARASDNAAVGPLFRKFKPAVWLNGVSASRANSGQVTDPLARAPGNVLVETPVALVRGNGAQNARGVWEVRNAAGAHAGYYVADFARVSSWKLAGIELLPAAAPAPEVAEFCEVPGDIQRFHERSAAITDGEIAKLLKKSKPLATCIEGPDCADKMALAKAYIGKNSLFPLVRDTDTLLLTAGPVYTDTHPSFAVALDPPSPDRRRTMRFRAWCGNMFACFPSNGKSGENFLAALGEAPAERKAD